MTKGNLHRQRPARHFLGALIASTGLALAGAAAPAFAQDSQKNPAGFRIEAKSNVMDWNGVVITKGQIFVGGPRWTGFPGPAVGKINKKGDVVPFPNQKWNNWKAGEDGANYFVCVNAIHLGPDGALWVVDPGAPVPGGPVVPNGAKLVKIDPKSGKVLKVYLLGKDVIHPNSYINDIRFNPKNDLAYITDTGSEAVIVFDTKNGHAWRVLEGHPSTLASEERPIIADGKRLEDRPGHASVVPVDPLEVSPDGQWLYYGPVAGPWSRVPTKLIDDPETPAPKIAAAVELWADLPAVGGTSMDEKGNLYYTNLKDNSIDRRDPSGKTVRLFSDPILHWGDAPVIADGRLWVPVPQMDRLPQYHQGKSLTQLPIILFSVDLKALEKNLPASQPEIK